MNHVDRPLRVECGAVALNLNSFWHDAEVDYLLALASWGMSCKQIAGRLGRSQSAVADRLSRAMPKGLVRVKFNGETRRRMDREYACITSIIVSEYAAGMAQAHIVEKYATSSTLVRQTLTAAGKIKIKPRNGGQMNRDSALSGPVIRHLPPRQRGRYLDRVFFKKNYETAHDGFAAKARASRLCDGGRHD